MRDGEFTLSYGSTVYTFGPADLPAIIASAPDLGSAGVRTDDVDRPRADGVAFGQDYRTGLTLTFDLLVVGADEAETWENLATLATAWRADSVRSDPGEVAELTYRLAGRERTVYGRPRRFAHNDELVHEGVISVLADLSTVDDQYYASTAQSRTVSIAPPAGGGLLAPLSAPLTTTATSDRSVVIAVGGALPAWPVITIEGPITNPVVDVVGLWRMELTATLAVDEAVTIDTRPWRRSVLRNVGGSLAGKFTRASARLSSAALPPGSHEIALRGTDGTGTAALTVEWRDTYSV
ncbi:hypothetical protein AB0H43_03030 [Hamadaea sp. NPDC050747]|uniref:hypothetical protein n=1 Tax=Hamadaea sp. NPDC050747 TaxID=3155789 RepID=UPI0033CBD20B